MDFERQSENGPKAGRERNEEEMKTISRNLLLAMATMVVAVLLSGGLLLLAGCGTYKPDEREGLTAPIQLPRECIDPLRRRDM